MVVAGISVVGVLVLGFGHTLRLDANIVNGLVLSMGVLIPVLPTASLAWLEPDWPEEA